MRYRSLLYSLIVCCHVVLLPACQSDDIAPSPQNSADRKLTFSPSVEGMTVTPLSRAPGSVFFVDGDAITVEIKTSRDATVVPYVYTYGGGKFTGDFVFQTDNSYIVDLEAWWPTKDSPARDSIITDQRLYENYMQANRLKAVAHSANIMPTAEPVPLVFSQEHSRVTFRLAGQNANGLIIKSLVLELHADIDEDGTKEDKGFWAYCTDGGEINAMLVVPAGVHLGPEPPVAGNGRIPIGLVTVGSKGSSEHDYRGIIYIPSSTDITLEPNHDYLITLTPEGYDMFGAVSIARFPQGEGKVAIPFQLPELNSVTGLYEISTVAQLITVSWLLDADFNGQLQADWIIRDFDIVNDITVSARVKQEGYLKESILKNYQGRFSNTDRASYFDGSLIF